MLKPFSSALTIAIALCCTQVSAADNADQLSPSAVQSLAEDEAFVLVKVGVRGGLKQYVSSLNFSENNSDLELKVSKEKGFQLVKVKAGTYQPETFGIKSAQSIKAKRFENNDLSNKAVIIEPGTVTYIGQWDVAYGKRFELLGNTITTDKNGYRVSYSVNSVNEFASKNEWITEFPLRFSHISGQNVATTWQHINQEQYN